MPLLLKRRCSCVLFGSVWLPPSASSYGSGWDRPKRWSSLPAICWKKRLALIIFLFSYCYLLTLKFQRKKKRQSFSGGLSVRSSCAAYLFWLAWHSFSAFTGSFTPLASS